MHPLRAAYPSGWHHSRLPQSCHFIDLVYDSSCPPLAFSLEREQGGLSRHMWMYNQCLKNSKVGAGGCDRDGSK